MDGVDPGERRRLVIVGSGPVGMTAALLLADSFESVIVLEKRSKERFLETHGYTFPIVLSPAAQDVLRSVGVQSAIEAQRSPYFGVVVHRLFMGREFTWTAKRSGIYSHWRNHIVRSLYDRVTERGIDVRFETRIDDIDFDRCVVTEASAGELPFDLLLGADGMHSQVRSFLAEAHPEFPSEAFQSELLDRWYAYRMPSVGQMHEAFGGEPDGHALHIHTSNPSMHPHDKFRVVTVAMQQPDPEISVVIKHGSELGLKRIEEINRDFFAAYATADEIADGWARGLGGEYRHVRVPTYALGSTLLVGDAAHGTEGNGDLINLGITSVSALLAVLEESDSVEEAVATYDRTVGAELRYYSRYTLRRSREKIKTEVGLYELGAILRLNGHHPSMWGIYEDDFEVRSYIERYRRDRWLIPVRLAAVFGLAAAAVVTARSAVRRHRI